LSEKQVWTLDTSFLPLSGGAFVLLIQIKPELFSKLGEEKSFAS
jgi:hypothetical protein